MIKNLLEKIRSFSKEGLFHIFGSRVLSQVLAMISSMVVVRFLDKTQYGHYVSANNLYSYPAIFVGLGMTSAIMQYCSEKGTQERKNAIFRHAFINGNGANILVCLAIAALAAWKYLSGKPEVAFYLLLMSLLPFVTYADTFSQSALRIKRKNQIFSYANIAYSVVLLLGNVALTNLFDVPGLIYSRYIAYSVSAVFCLSVLNRERFFNRIFAKDVRLPKEEKKQISGFAAICAITNFSSVVLTLLDVTCLDIVLEDPTVLADYHVAAAIPAACVFVPSSLMVFYYPKLVEAMSDGKKDGVAQAMQIAKTSALVNGFVFVCLEIFAPLIIWIIYGEKYMNVVPMFRVLSLNYLVYCVSDIMGNMIAAVRKVRVNLTIAVISGILNICLNLTLIPRMGSIGAAVATLCVSATVAVLDFIYVRHYFKTN